MLQLKMGSSGDEEYCWCGESKHCQYSWQESWIKQKGTKEWTCWKKQMHLHNVHKTASAGSFNIKKQQMKMIILISLPVSSFCFKILSMVQTLIMKKQLGNYRFITISGFIQHNYQQIHTKNVHICGVPVCYSCCSYMC